MHSGFSDSQKHDLSSVEEAEHRKTGGNCSRKSNRQRNNQALPFDWAQRHQG